MPTDMPWWLRDIVIIGFEEEDDSDDDDDEGQDQDLLAHADGHREDRPGHHPGEGRERADHLLLYAHAGIVSCVIDAQVLPVAEQHDRQIVPRHADHIGAGETVVCEAALRCLSRQLPAEAVTETILAHEVRNHPGIENATSFVNAAIEQYVEKSGNDDLKIWGYRNVWYRFHPSEANVYVPVSLNMFAVMENAFMNTFLSQKDASFPSYEHDGPFSELAQKIQVEQYHTLKICLGREWFHENPSALIRATRGLVFLREMDLEEFYRSSRRLKQMLENR